MTTSRFGTVRFRTTATAAAAVLVVLALTGAALVIVQRRVLVEGLDERAAQQVNLIVEELSNGRIPAGSIGTGDEDTVASVTTADGALVWTTAENPVPSSAEDVRTTTRVVTTDRGMWTVTITTSLDDVDEATRALALVLLMTVPLVVALLTLLVWWLVGRTLEPVEAIRREVATISGTDLHRRVPEPQTTDEVGRLARTMNDMLDRVENSSVRQQQFVADASHELRSPLTRIRTQLEVDLAHPGRRDPSVIEQSVLDDAIQMQQLVDDLLFLARHDARASPRESRSVDLRELAEDAARRAVRAGIEVRTTGQQPATALGDPRALARAVRNVVENAVRHAHAAVEVDVGVDGAMAVLAVTDDGEGVPRDEQERVFERFARVDGARSRSSGGTGLGLAITREIVEQHGGTIAFDPDAVRGARIILRLPLEPADR